MLPATPSPCHPLTPSSSAGWIEVDEAARRSGRSAGHVRRQCRDDYAARGLAREIEGGGRRRRWQVREDADPAFARVKFPEQIGADLRQVPEKKRQQAIERKKILNDWWKAREGGLKLGFVETQVTEQFLTHLEAETGTRISRRTLFYWESRWRQKGLTGLVDARAGNAQGAGSLGSDPFLEEVKRLYLAVRRLKLTVCRELAIEAANRQGWTVRSYTTCQRFINQIPLAVVKKMRFGEEAYTNDAAPWIERDYTSLRSNEIWCADHHQFDVIVNVQGKLARPWLTAWQDLRSRKIVGWRIFAHDPSSDPILLAFADACLAEGVPENVYVDNGKDFDCYALNGRTKADRWAKRRVRFELDPGRAGVFPSLGIEVIHAWPYHGQSKPVERFFGTIEQQTPVFPTYCGSSPQDKPEDLQLQLERGKAPAMGDFVAWFAGWLGTYHDRGHLGDGMEGKSPNVVYAENLHAKRTTTAEVLAVHCLRVIPEAKVGQNGVTYKGLRYGQYELNHLLGKDVVLRVDDNDLSRVQVWSTDGKFLALAHANAKLPFNPTSQEVRDAIADKKRSRQILKDWSQERLRMADSLEDRLIRARAAQASAAEPDPNLPPPSIQPVRSALEGELPALRAAHERSRQRKAVGAESVDLEQYVEGQGVAPAPQSLSIFERFEDAMDGG
jgi:putative transposase